MSGPNPEFDKLDKLFEEFKVESDAMKEALAEIAKEERDKKRVAAKELVRKALDLRDSMDKAEKKFKNEQGKFQKELGKLLNRINQMAAGQQPAEEEDKDKENATQG